MITKDNIKKLLSALNFEQDGDMFTKSYEGVRSLLKVDVRNEHFYYKEIGITVGRETTSNFLSQRILLFSSVLIAYLRWDISLSI